MANQTSDAYPHSIPAIIKYLHTETSSGKLPWKLDNGNLVTIPPSDTHKIFALTYPIELNGKVLLAIYADKTYRKSTLINIPVESTTYQMLSDLYVLAKSSSDMDLDEIYKHIIDLPKSGK